MMRKNKQLIVDQKNGDCMRACFTSMLGLPNDPKLIPSIGDPEWWLKYQKFFGQFGLSLIYEDKRFWRNGLWVASVKSKNFKTGTHAIVMRDFKVEFDPSTKKRYRTGRSMIGSDLVQGGWFFQVIDPSKLGALDKFRVEKYAH